MEGPVLMVSEPAWGPARADVLTQESPPQRLPASCPTALVTQAARPPYFTKGGLTPTKLDGFSLHTRVNRSTQTWGPHSSEMDSRHEAYRLQRTQGLGAGPCSNPPGLRSPDFLGL